MQTATIQAATVGWVVDTVSLLPSRERKQLRDYLNFLVWKTRQHEPESLAQKIIKAVEHSNEVTMDDALALLKTIEEGKKVMQFDSPFEPEGK